MHFISFFFLAFLPLKCNLHIYFALEMHQNNYGLEYLIPQFLGSLGSRFSPKPNNYSLLWAETVSVVKDDIINILMVQQNVN